MLGVVLAVMAGVLAMHVLSVVPSGSGYEAGHGQVRLGGDGLDAPGPVSADPASGAAAGSAEVLLIGEVRVAAMAFASAAAGEGESTAVGGDGGSGTGHGLCPEAVPGHCPDLPALMSMCQAVLDSAAAALLLLLLLLLGLVSRGSVWTTGLGLRSPDRRAHGEWRAWCYRPRVEGPSLNELCISRT